jgi:hypothetical protein
VHSGTRRDLEQISRDELWRAAQQRTFDIRDLAKAPSVVQLVVVNYLFSDRTNPGG